MHCFDVENAIEHMLDEISNMREDIKALQLKTQKLRKCMMKSRWGPLSF